MRSCSSMLWPRFHFNACIIYHAFVCALIRKLNNWATRLSPTTHKIVFNSTSFIRQNECFNELTCVAKPRTKILVQQIFMTSIDKTTFRLAVAAFSWKYFSSFIALFRFIETAIHERNLGPWTVKQFFPIHHDKLV